MEKRLRELQREIATTNLENVTLKALLGGEQELRDDRTVEETHALLLVNDDLKQNIAVAEEEKRKAKKQHDFAEQQAGVLEKAVAESGQRVNELVQQLQANRQHTQEQIAKLEVEFRKVNAENRQLKISKDKNEVMAKQLEREVEKLTLQEKQLEGEWTKRMTDLELLIGSRRTEASNLLLELQAVNEELGLLRVQSQSNSFRLEYEGALKEVYDTHQFESRLRRMNAELQQSETKAQALREELQRVNKQWTEYYEEAIRGLRLRIEEINGQAQLEQIERLLTQVKEKDALLSQLQYGINDIEKDLRRGESSDSELQQAKEEYEEKLKLYHRLLNEKTILYDQMYVSARQLINRDDLIVNNEQEIVRIKYDIDLSKLEMEQKKELVVELETQLEQLKQQYKELKLDIKRLEKRAEQLTHLLKQKEDEMDQLEEMLRDRDNVIEELER